MLGPYIKSRGIRGNMEVIWWKFVINLFLIFGVLGNRMLNSEVLKCHEDLINKEKQ